MGFAEIEINKLPLKGKRAFIIENDITALTFPKIDDSIVIFGKDIMSSFQKKLNG